MAADSAHYFASSPSDAPVGSADQNRFLGPTLLAVYLLLAAVVLTNLLIAMARPPPQPSPAPPLPFPAWRRSAAATSRLVTRRDPP